MKYCAELVKEMADWVAENGLEEYGGATVTSFCEHFGIARDTFYKWSQKPTFQTALRDARKRWNDNAATNLRASLYKCATGYEVKETRTEYVPAEKGEPSIKKSITFKRYVQPNPDTARYLLQVMKPDEWVVHSDGQGNDASRFEELLMRAPIDE
ncbi:MAG: hypothetical protein LUC22_02965 [Prevotella sp.]|nr:hypothetical protein [Prevotella sp.]